MSDTKDWNRDEQKAMEHLSDAMKGMFLAAAWLHVAGHSSDGERIHALAKTIACEFHGMLREDADET
jgi:hypothetical protein